MCPVLHYSSWRISYHYNIMIKIQCIRDTLYYRVLQVHNRISTKPGLSSPVHFYVYWPFQGRKHIISSCQSSSLFCFMSFRSTNSCGCKMIVYCIQWLIGQSGRVLMYNMINYLCMYKRCIAHVTIIYIYIYIYI